MYLGYFLIKQSKLSSLICLSSVCKLKGHVWTSFSVWYVHYIYMVLSFYFDNREHHFFIYSFLKLFSPFFTSQTVLIWGIIESPFAKDCSFQNSKCNQFWCKFYKVVHLLSALLQIRGLTTRSILGYDNLEIKN